jgi:hypothetical protein
MLSDSEIQDLIDDAKPLSSKVLKEIQLKNKENRAYKEYDLDVKSKSDKIFRIIEKDKFRDFHIHKATRRYPDAGFRIDGYAEVTDSYNNWKDALTKMLKDCNFKGEMSLFNNFN